MNVVVRKLNSACYHYRENRWRWDPRFRGGNASIPIDRPIFLLGTQGGGLTLAARILRRHPQLVSVTGNHRYWAGNDEMQNVLEDALPEALTWRKMQLPGFGKGLHSWMYASDAYLPHYVEDGGDTAENVGESFRGILRGILRLNRPRDTDGPVRFLDKSQTYTLRIGLLQQILGDCSPKFVLITRDPFALCWRATWKVISLRDLELTDEQKFEIAVQHWQNSMEHALSYEGRVDFSWWRFEDLLREPERILREICEFTELPFDPRILPGPEDHIPWGSSFDAFNRGKWYPLRADVNDSYLREIPDWAIESISRRCASMLRRFGYTGLPSSSPQVSPPAPDATGEP